MENPGRTLVCSVLFLDIVEYSKKSVAEQTRLKDIFNGVLADALEAIASRDRVISDTGDGAAVTFFGDPEKAFLIALAIRDNATRLPMRIGINLGPVRLVKDLNGQVNVLGDGINVAQRVMSFSQPGQLLASRSFCEVLSSLSPHYARLFTREGLRTDKHVREHEVYSVARDVRARVRGAPAPAADTALLHRAADVFDAGAHLIISGYTQSSVQDALDKFAQGGSQMISDITPVGNKWVAACEHPLAPVSACKVEKLGRTRIVTGPTQQAVSAKVAELVEFGAVVVREIECAGGVWTAVCEVRQPGR